MLNSMPTSIWFEWLAYMDIEPLGVDMYTVQQVASLQALTYNINRGRGKTPQSAKQFMPPFKKSKSQRLKEQKQVAQQHLRILERTKAK